MKFPISNFKFPIARRAGFTMIELLVSMTVFIILMGLIADIFISSLRSQRTLVALMAANDNASLMLEQLARDIRTGSNFCIADSSGACTSPPVTQGAALAFTNAAGTQVIYRFNALDSDIEKSEDNGATFSILTSANVLINNLVFRLVDQEISSGPNDPWPPRVTITLKVGSTDQQLSGITTNLETSVSSRNIE